MTPPRNIRFVEQPEWPIDDVLVAIAPFDAFSGQMVATGVRAQISLIRDDGGSVRFESLQKRAIRNLSGLLVFVMRPEERDPQARFRIELDAFAAGYFNPPAWEFKPPPQDDVDWANRLRCTVALHRRPAAVALDDATVVFGVVGRQADGGDFQPAANARIQARVPPPLLLAPPAAGKADGPDFETRSDERGAFALPLRLAAQMEPGAHTNVSFWFAEGGDRRDFERQVQDGVLHSFAEAINLTGDNEPELLPFVSEAENA